MLAIFGAYGSSFLGISPGSSNPVFVDGANVIKALNLSNCNFVSNDWVYLRYYNISAFSPFEYNETISSYPSILFYSIGPNSTAVKAYNTGTNYAYGNFSIHVPASYVCRQP